MRVSIKIDNMFHFDISSVPKMSVSGPMLGSNLIFWGIKCGQEPSQSDCDTTFVDFHP